jgi:hypothetical protein
MSGPAACAALALALALPLAMALAGCASAPAPLPAGPGRTLDFGTRAPLRLELPPGYVMESEHAATFAVYHVWRVPPPPLKQDTSLGIFVGVPASSYCEPDAGSYRPAAFRDWAVRWHLCAETGAAAQVWETHITAGTPAPLHVFIIGTDPAELQRLRAIAETLRLR